MTGTETPPAWLLEKHGTLEKALLAADLAVVDHEATVGAAHRQVREALERQRASVEEFNQLDREYMAAYDRLQNVRRHRDWVERLATERLLAVTYTDEALDE